MPEKSCKSNSANTAYRCKAGPGCVVLVVGPSGAGKDTLLRGAAENLRNTSEFSFPRRIVTRISDPALEDHLSTTLKNFREADSNGMFAISWYAHGNGYALPAAILDDVAAGKAVIFNASREIVAKAKERFENVHCVLVSVPEAELARRLAIRGRETEGQILERLARQPARIPAGGTVHELSNTGSVMEGVEKLVDLLVALHSSPAESAGKPSQNEERH